MEANKSLVAADLEKEIQIYDKKYLITVTQVKGGILIALKEKFNISKIWKNSFILKELQKEKLEFLNFPEIIFLQSFVCKRIINDNYSFSFQENGDAKLIFKLVLTLGDFENELIIDFILKNEKQDYSNTLEQLCSHMSQFDEEICSSNKKTMKMFADFKQEYDIKLENSLNDLKNNLKLSKYGIKLFPNFINPNNANYTVNDLSVKKNSGGDSWYGFKSDVTLQKLGRYHFSIKINQTNNNSNFMIGFAISAANPSAGYYANSIMFSLNNGYVYIKGANTQSAYGLKGSTNDIYTIVIDTKLKTTFILLNGVQCGIPKTFDFGENDLLQLTPAVDVCTTGDQISMVDYNLEY
jgi:hypothetical protein